MKKKRFMSIAVSLLFTVHGFFTGGCETSNKEDRSTKDSIQNEKLIKPEDAILTLDTLIVNQEPLIKFSEDNEFRCLLRADGDTIVKFNDYYNSIRFLDINQDGYSDIRVFVNSNSPNQCINYFFDNQSNGYKEITNSYLDIELIRDSNLFYSYNSTGCGDMNWVSHISKIENFEETNIGSIEVNACGNKDEKINIYKLNNSNKVRIDSNPITVLEKQNKFDFIREYWRRNYALFQ
ncbi:hypothetical protein [Emticicia sp. 21SJ11W-3]|uniref:hypothetical protein n=1 Tax=Emticicia sp. 21SJ11W-3 TaxID=2916755 RepID=UPI00209E7AC0|nr:hypothetical protein [Emticicia sp. 21SJ11W-3]UTA66871.1 hypothetical protein MB380_14805 [Emticicia sp. 21SJ11W-3]